MGGYCRLQMPLRLALGVRGTVAGRRLGGLPPPPSNASLVPGPWTGPRSPLRRGRRVVARSAVGARARCCVCVGVWVRGPLVRLRGPWPVLRGLSSGGGPPGALDRPPGVPSPTPPPSPPVLQTRFQGIPRLPPPLVRGCPAAPGPTRGEPATPCKVSCGGRGAQRFRKASISPPPPPLVSFRPGMHQKGRGLRCGPRSG